MKICFFIFSGVFFLRKIKNLQFHALWLKNVKQKVVFPLITLQHVLVTWSKQKNLKKFIQGAENSFSFTVLDEV